MTPRQWVGAWLFGLSMATFIIGQIAVRMHDVDASETRLVITYWWLWLIVFILAFIGIAMMGEQKRV